MVTRMYTPSRNDGVAYLFVFQLGLPNLVGSMELRARDKWSLRNKNFKHVENFGCCLLQITLLAVATLSTATSATTRTAPRA